MAHDLTDEDLDALADDVAARLPTGSYGDRVVLKRRTLLGIASGTLGTGALLSLGVDPATAQAASGTVGTSGSPVDVEAASVNAESLSTEDLAYSGDPPGAVVEIGSNQTIANDTVTEIGFDTAIRDAGNLLNSANNSIDVPSGFSFAKVVCQYQWTSSGRDVDLFRPRINGDDTTPGTSLFTNVNTIRNTRTARSDMTPWVSVSDNDSITYEIRQVSGSSADLDGGGGKTFMEVWLI